MCIGEWWNADTEAVINQALQTGAGPNVSDAYTINGLPGPLYNCSQNGIYIYSFEMEFHDTQRMLFNILIYLLCYMLS